MDKYTLSVYLEKYLAQWYIHENDGTTPITPKKLSTESRIIEVYSTKTPANIAEEEPDESLVEVKIVIPHFRCKDPQYYNYLPREARCEFKRCVRNRFVIELWNDLHRFGYIGKRRDKLITAWMESHGIEDDDTNFRTILKIYQRQYKNYLERRRRERNSKEKQKKA